MSGKQSFLTTLDEEHARTLRVLRAYPDDKLDLKPSERSNSARQLAWTFVMERRLGTAIWADTFKNGMPKDRPAPPAPPETMDEIVAALEKVQSEWRELIANASDEELQQQVHFFVAPKTIGPMTKMNLCWFLLHDEIHHRGQMSVYLRMAGGKVPSIYGPSADEPWM
jgi:uncharacterized damage-inducible protein DinB